MCNNYYKILDTKKSTKLNFQKNNFMLKREIQNPYIPIPHKGCVFTISKVEESKVYKCDPECFCLRTESYSSCEHKSLEVNYKKKQLECLSVELHIIVTQAASKAWHVRPEHIAVVDSDGYSHKGEIICDNIIKKGNYASRYDDIHICTQANIIYIFPNVKIRNILLIDSQEDFTGAFMKEEHSEFSTSFYEQIQQQYSHNKTRETSNNSSQTRYKQEKLMDDINYLRLLIHKRFTNDLLPTEKRDIEEQIDNKTYALSLEVKTNKWESNPEVYPFIQELRTDLENYEYQINASKELDCQQQIKIQKVEDLLNVDPYQFEHMSAQLLKEQGFTDIKVTKRSNDKGIDIVCRKGNDKYVAQCKRYSNNIGSPEMQMFIGAVLNARADRGIYVTTSEFTREAQVMARLNNIELVDKYKLFEWISIDTDYKANDTLF